MSMLTLKELNAETRELFNQWYEDAMEPKKNLISERVGIGYVTFKLFTTGKKDMTYQNIYKLNQFLDSQGYQLKEHA